MPESGFVATVDKQTQCPPVFRIWTNADFAGIISEPVIEGSPRPPVVGKLFFNSI